MAETNVQEAPNENINEDLLIWLSVPGGIGITVMIVALAVGVVVPDISGGLIGGLVLLGLVMLIFSVGAWAIVTQPHRNFDDITVPQYTGHHDHDDEHSDDH